MPFNTVDRRVFIRTGGLALLSMGLDPLFLSRAAYAVKDGARRAGGKTLVCVFQRGAVDGLSAVAPYAERLYYEHRPGIALPPPQREGGVIDLDGRFGLHPALASLHPLFADGSLAIVHAVGLPTATRSHFDAQDFMESGTPGIKATRDGWLNRYIGHASEHVHTPFRGVAMGANLPRILRGSAPALAISNLQTFGVRAPGRPRDRVTDAFEELYQGSDSGIVAETSAESFEAIRMLKAARPETREPGHGASYPASPFGQSMRQLAQLIKADLGLEIGFADVGGWDTHVNQGTSQGQLALRLKDFGDTLGAFVRDLGPKMSDVVVLTMSEFGRTVRENGTRGTDHGRATAMMVLGGEVSGGQVLGRWPTLEPNKLEDGRDLTVTTDFRDLFSEVIVGHLGATDLGSIFPGYDATLAKWPGVMKQ